MKKDKYNSKNYSKHSLIFGQFFRFQTMCISKNILAFLLWSIGSGLGAQQAEKIDFERINDKKVVELLKEYGAEYKQDIARLTSRCYSAEDSLSFSSHTKTLEIDGPIDEVWNVYKTISPTEDDEDKVRFGILYSPNPDKLYYLSDAYDGIKEGQVVFWNLRFLFGLVQVAVGQKIMEVNDKDKFLKICYLAEGKSHGTQYIQLYPMDNDKTKIVHYTRYRSASKFRDRRLYPKLHDKAITEFHEDVIERVAEIREGEE